MGFPSGSSVKNLHCRRLRFNPWVGKTPWWRAWQPTLVFLPGESHGQKNLAGYSPQGGDWYDWAHAHKHTHTHTHTHMHTHAHTHTNMHTQTHTSTHTCIDTNTHTHACLIIHISQLQNSYIYWLQPYLFKMVLSELLKDCFLGYSPQ